MNNQIKFIKIYYGSFENEYNIFVNLNEILDVQFGLNHDKKSIYNFIIVINYKNQSHCELHYTNNSDFIINIKRLSKELDLDFNEEDLLKWLEIMED